MELYVNISFISIFYLFFWFSRLPISQLQTEKVMTSQIRSHIEYLMQNYYILLLILYSKSMKNLAIMAGFNTI